MQEKNPKNIGSDLFSIFQVSPRVSWSFTVGGVSRKCPKEDSISFVVCSKGIVVDGWYVFLFFFG